MTRESFIFYASFHNALKKLDSSQYGKVVSAICEYALNGKEPDFQDDVVSDAMFTLIKPQIDANNERYENGKKGGRPKKNTEIAKPMVYENDDVAKPNVNVNVNVNDNDNVNVNDNGNGKENGNVCVNETHTDTHTEAPENDKHWSAGKFKPPTLEEVKEYAKLKGYANFNAQKFLDFNDAGGWLMGNRPIINWQKVADMWASNPKYKPKLPMTVVDDNYKIDF